MGRSVVWARRAEREADRLEPLIRTRILLALNRLAEGHLSDVVRLADLHPPEWRLRVGNWRVRFRYVPGALEVLRVLPRDKAYK